MKVITEYLLVVIELLGNLVSVELERIDLGGNDLQSVGEPLKNLRSLRLKGSFFYSMKFK